FYLCYVLIYYFTYINILFFILLILFFLCLSFLFFNYVCYDKISFYFFFTAFSKNFSIILAVILRFVRNNFFRTVDLPDYFPSFFCFSHKFFGFFNPILFIFHDFV